ncbi:DUF1365 domain-containing protein [Caenimonas aquaedulcis]|uniref:DUF1365 domain-containing protein n=1 Tax=Caenimonas aquaedulcis TaxID=2793270 RepID=A0A931MHZ2_9BURK|nr:DUF1365 domain-containing protein [Caenimonas aquaedulcis]MBG9389581.1 DUF1365 domain-containing protein [Caenimonas aquaedulcis]
MTGPLLGIGHVRHARLRPVAHAFRYPTLFLLLPMRALHAGRWALAHNRAGIISFHDSDHGDGGANALTWLDALLARHGIGDATGEAWLHCYPRMGGYTFKPVSFWYCHRADGTLRAVVAEVNNTFGERHAYVLDAAAWGSELRAGKEMHVSPFCRVEGGYRFRFFLDLAQGRTLARVDYDDAQGPLLRTSVGGSLQPATRSALLSGALRFPLLMLGVMARIHWQALRLWLARVPFFPHVRRGADPIPTGSTTR